MRRVYRLTAIIPLFVWAAPAQDTAAMQKLTDTLKFELQQKKAAIGGVMGPVVKNAPYSAVEVTENTQTLADGTRIHEEQQVPVYRDSEGRVRRESSPDQVMIWDPVANVSYILNPKTQTARKMPLEVNTVYRAKGGERAFAYRAAPGGELRAHVVTTGAAQMLTLKAQRTAKSEPKNESLGKQMMEGVAADGTRETSTLEAGAIGNDRPIQITSESWYSSDLQTLVKSVHTDPRTGEETFQLTNISRVEPPSTLFQVPAEYQVINPKLRTTPVPIPPE